MPDEADSRPRKEPFPTGPSDSEIAERLQRIRDELKQVEGVPDLPDEVINPRLDLPPTPDLPDYEQRLRDLEQRADAVKNARNAKMATEARQQSGDANTNRGLGIGMAVAYALLGITFLGIAIGWILDVKMGTKIYRGFGALIGSVLGIVGAVVLLNRYQAQEK